MSEAFVLNVVLFLPLLGAALLLVSPTERDDFTRRLTLALMIVQFALTAWLYMRFDSKVAGLQFETRLPWIESWGVHYQIGLDGYNILLVMLTAFLGPLVTDNPLVTTLVSVVPPLPYMPPVLRGTFTALILVIRGVSEQAKYMALATTDPVTDELKQPNVLSQPASFSAAICSGVPSGLTVTVETL